MMFCERLADMPERQGIGVFPGTECGIEPARMMRKRRNHAEKELLLGAEKLEEPDKKGNFVSETHAGLCC